MTRKGKPLSFEIATRLTQLDKVQLEHVELPEVDKFVDEKIARKKANHYTKPAKQMPKSLRPLCGARTRAGGRCRATPVWDKVNNQPKNGRCRMHGGLSTGPKTNAGKRKALACLAKGRETMKARRVV
jgi:hypothetical protein